MTTIERDTTGKINAIAQYSAALVVSIAWLVTAFSLYLVFILQWHGPFRDLWEFMPAIEQELNGLWSLTYLIEAYGGAHRIFFPKLLFFADWQWFGGKNTLTITVAIACQSLYLAVIANYLQKEGSLDKHKKRLVTGAFLLALFSTTQVSNFLYAMDVQWYMSNLLSLLAFTALTGHKEKTALFLVLGSGAALCNFTGLMSLIAGAGWIVARHRINRQSITVLLLVVTFGLVYSHNPQMAEHVTIAALQQTDNLVSSVHIIAGALLKMAVYLTRYLASPLSREWPWAGTCLSIAMIIITLVYWKRNMSRTLSTWQQLCLLIASYILLSGIATAFGRAIYPNSAIAERYQTLVLPLLPAVIGLVLPDIKSTSPWYLSPLFIAILIGLHLLPSQLNSARDMAILSNRVNLAHTAARAGVLERPYIGATLSHPLLVNNINMVKVSDPFLRSRQLGYFNAFQDVRLGEAWKPAADNLPACTDPVLPEVDEALGVWIIKGPLLETAKHVTDIVLSQQAKIIGIGIRIRPEGNVLPSGWIPANERRFQAFALSANLTADEPLLVSGLANGKTVCHQVLPPR